MIILTIICCIYFTIQEKMKALHDGKTKRLEAQLSYSRYSKVIACMYLNLSVTLKVYGYRSIISFSVHVLQALHT